VPPLKLCLGGDFDLSVTEVIWSGTGCLHALELKRFYHTLHRQKIPAQAELERGTLESSDEHFAVGGSMPAGRRRYFTMLACEF